MQVVHAGEIEILSSIDATALPSEFRLFSLGVNQTKKGDFILDAEGMASVMKQYTDHGVELSFDYEHSAHAGSGAAPAAAWFNPEARADGLWATNVRWTDKAAAHLRAKEYRYFSPTFHVDKANRITRLVNAALTNLPASKKQQALIAASEATNGQKDMNPMSFNAVIGLKDDASEQEAGDRIVSLATVEKQLLEFTGKSTVAEAMSLVISAKDTAVKLSAAEKALEEWHDRDEQTKALEEQKALDAAIDGAVSSGRVSLRDTEGLAKLKKFGETYKIEALREHIAMLPARPARVYQAPALANTEESRLRAVQDYAAANSLSIADAYVQLSAKNPSLFEGGR